MSDFILISEDADRAQKNEVRKNHRRAYMKAYGKDYRIKNKEKWNEYYKRYNTKNHDKIMSRWKRYTEVPVNRIKRLIYTAKRRAKKRNIPWDREALWIFVTKPPTHCECCGVELDYSLGTGPGRAKRRVASIDRIDSQCGYTAGNVAVICYRCNVLKSDASEADLLALLAYVRKHASGNGAA